MILKYRGKGIQIDEKYLYLLNSPKLLYYDAKGYLKFTKGKRNEEYRNKQIHRVIYELENGCLNCYKVVHHYNENILDNRLCNLCVLLRGEHTRNHWLGRTHNEKTKVRIRDTRVGMTASDKTKLKMKTAMAGKHKGVLNPFFGRHHTEETKQKMRNAHRLRKLNELKIRV